MDEVPAENVAKPIAKNGDFVTATIINQKKPDDSTRQGILFEGKLLGETGEEYVLSPKGKLPTVVPDRNLWGSTADFVTKKRLELATAKKN